MEIKQYGQMIEELKRIRPVPALVYFSPFVFQSAFVANPTLHLNEVTGMGPRIEKIY